MDIMSMFSAEEASEQATDHMLEIQLSDTWTPGRKYGDRSTLAAFVRYFMIQELPTDIVDKIAGLYLLS